MFFIPYIYFCPFIEKWTNDLNRRYDPAVAGNNKILYKREHLGLVQCIVIFFADQLTHLIQVSFNSLQWVILGQTPTGVEPNEGALRLLQQVLKKHQITATVYSPLCFLGIISTSPSSPLLSSKNFNVLLRFLLIKNRLIQNPVTLILQRGTVNLKKFKV